MIPGLGEVPILGRLFGSHHNEGEKTEIILSITPRLVGRTNLPDAQMVTSYDAPARPQFWQLHGDKGVGINFIAFYSPKSELSDLGKDFAKRYQAKFNEPPVYAALNGFANAIIFAAAIEKAKSTDPNAMIKALEEGSFIGWSTTPVTFPRAEGALWHNWSPPLLILRYTKPNQTAAEAEVAYTLGEK